ncbi:hypothetical protein [Streptomyces sp. MNP-20]|uniref:hypothetical protein n=1 Tax=Streptomyces sp. MNP-20 TaxID=2721165 RepID=UPI001C1DE23E|nr:hypothetical protein [Streptomyces sp. MNP-20]
MIADLIKPLHELDWTDTPSVELATAPILARLDEDRELLTRLLDQVPTSPDLVALAEHYDILDKVVLHDDPAGWRLRLHVFLPGYFDRPHNHRWTSSSRILTGSYQHTLYSLDGDLSEDLDVAALRPCMERTEKAGDGYTLHHAMIHAAVAEPYTVTLIIRGPAQKDRFLVADRTTGKAWWQYGAARESADLADAKRMSSGRFADVRAKLDELGLTT